MRFDVNILLAVFSWMVLISPVLTAQAFNTEAGATVFVNPEKVTVKIDETFNVLVNVSEVSKLQGFDFMLTYDKRVLNCSGVEEGTFLSASGPTFIAKREIDASFTHDHGRVWFAVVVYGIGFSNGNGTLAVITFEAIAKGETALDLYSDYPLRQAAVKLTTCGSEAIANTAVDGLVTVVAGDSGGSNDPPPTSNADPPVDPPSVDVNRDGVVDITDLVFVAAAYGTVKGDLRYNARADLDQNDVVDIRDIMPIARAYLYGTRL